jgi:hypothetical protein
MGLVVAKVLLELARWPLGSCWNWPSGHQGLVGVGLVAISVLLELAWWSPRFYWN